MRTLLAVVSVVLLSMWLGGSVLAQDKPASPEALAEGRTLYSKLCTYCHGEDGRTTLWDSFPIIAGQQRKYTFLVMRGYKTGERKGLASSSHDEVNDLVNEEQIRSIAEYVATLK